MKRDYSDIISFPHHRSARRAHMSIPDRAVQFAPFAALTGHNDAIRETARLTDEKTDLSEQRTEELNRRVRILQEKTDSRPELTVELFVDDEKKSGGRYVTHTGRLRRLDDVLRCLIFEDGIEIPLDSVVRLSGDIFGESGEK